MENKFFLLASLSRSLDKFHTENNLTHLIGSFIYTNYFNIEKLKDLESNENLIIIRVGDRNFMKAEVKTHNNKLHEFNIPLIYLLSNMRNGEIENINIPNKEYFADKTATLLNVLFNSFLPLPTFNHQRPFIPTEQGPKGSYAEHAERPSVNSDPSLNSEPNLTGEGQEDIFSREGVHGKEIYLNEQLNNCLFVFEDLNLLTVKLIFKNLNIIISGGRANNRELFSTTQYNLSNFLMKLDFKAVDVYNSFKYKNLFSKNNLTIEKLSESLITDTTIMKSIMVKKLLTIKSQIYDLIEENKKNVLTKKNNIISLEKEKLTLLNNKKEIKKSNWSGTKFFKLSKNIEKLQKIVTMTETEISELNSKLAYITKEIEDLLRTDLSEEEIKDSYFRNYHNDQILGINLKVKNLLKNKIKKRIKNL
uniref:Uncharacterized protein n=1 Tax=Pleurotus citrinopileatus TaxID=98342 RepID=A0A2K9YPE9_PLECI|nr:hypothetical protein [Pleurotus citrinopileatus]AUW35272.1 hypothetical protein [Pleurotus citrinopileatus]